MEKDQEAASSASEAPAPSGPTGHTAYERAGEGSPPGREAGWGPLAVWPGLPPPRAGADASDATPASHGRPLLVESGPTFSHVPFLCFPKLLLCASPSLWSERQKR